MFQTDLGFLLYHRLPRTVIYLVPLSVSFYYIRMYLLTVYKLWLRNFANRVILVRLVQ